MAVITLRGLTPEVTSRLKAMAARRRTSVNRYVVQLVEADVLGHTVGKPRQYDDLDDLFGRMNEAEHAAVTQALAKQRKIDGELWK